MNTVFLLFPLFVQVSLSLPISNYKYSERFSKPKRLKAVWSEARRQIVNDVHEQRIGKQKLPHQDILAKTNSDKRVENVEVLENAIQLALQRRKRSCNDWTCFDSRATDPTVKPTTTTTPPPPPTTPRSVTTTPQTTSTITQSSIITKIRWPFFPNFPKLPFLLPKMPSLPKIPFFG